jgi:tRNA A37 threonylcarbamoyladenosine synthetase subunit TsaC/SUA5/YrdC
MTEKDFAADARRVFDTAADGGVSIFQVDVGYAIVGNAEPAIRKIYEAKERSFSKPCGMFGNWDMFNSFIEIDDRARDVVSTIIHDNKLPFSIVAPFNAQHPIFANLTDFVIGNSTKAGTIDLLMNAGPVHDEIARLSLENLMPVLGSSANTSMTGSKFRLEDVEQPVRDAADLQIDYGLCKYNNDRGLGSSIIDLSDYSTIRVGCCYDQIREILREKFDIKLSDTARA